MIGSNFFVLWLSPIGVFLVIRLKDISLGNLVLHAPRVARSLSGKLV